MNTSRAHKHLFAGQYLVDSQTQNIPKTKYFPGKIVEFNKFFYSALKFDCSKSPCESKFFCYKQDMQWEKVMLPCTMTLANPNSAIFSPNGYPEPF